MDVYFDDGGERWCPMCNASYMFERYASYSRYERIMREWGSLDEYFEHHLESDVDIQWAQAVSQTLPLWAGDRVPFHGCLDDDEAENNQVEWNKALSQTLHLFDIPELYPEIDEKVEEREFSFDWMPDPDDADVVKFLICPGCGYIMYADN